MSALSELFGASRRLRLLTIASGAIAVAAMSMTSLLDKVASGQLPAVAFVKPDGTVTYFGGAAAKMAASGVDMTPVGAINKVTIDPCAGKPK